MIWNVLTVFSLILLAIYWRSKNAVWGSFTVGLIIGVLWKFLGSTDWYFVIKVGVIAIFLGFGAELLGMISNRFQMKK